MPELSDCYAISQSQMHNHRILFTFDTTNTKQQQKALGFMQHVEI